MTRVKICGITNPGDALAAAKLGAFAVGFIFYPKSRRCISPPDAAQVAPLLPPPVLKAGVFVNQPADFVNDVRALIGLDLVQLHGDESPDFCRKIKGDCMKAVRVKNSASLEDIGRYGSKFVLLDTFSDRRFGGTGESFDWNLLGGIDLKGKRIFLSGGLNSENVAEAVRRVKPYGVDVCSGVERKSGVKDAAKLKRFMEEVRLADRAD